MVNGFEITAAVDGITFVFSVCVSMFVSGTRWGRVEQAMKDLQADRVRQSDMTGVRERLSRIEGMFTLQLKDPGK